MNIQDFSDIKVGNIDVQQVFVGSKEVWSREPDVLEYVELEYSIANISGDTSIIMNVVGAAGDDGNIWYATSSSYGKLEIATESFTVYPSTDRSNIGVGMNNRAILCPPRNSNIGRQFRLDTLTASEMPSNGGTTLNNTGGAIAHQDSWLFATIPRTYLNIKYYNVDTKTFDNNITATTSTPYLAGCPTPYGILYCPWSEMNFAVWKTKSDFSFVKSTLTTNPTSLLYRSIYIEEYDKVWVPGAGFWYEVDPIDATSTEFLSMKGDYALSYMYRCNNIIVLISSDLTRQTQVNVLTREIVIDDELLSIPFTLTLQEWQNGTDMNKMNIEIDKNKWVTYGQLNSSGTEKIIFNGIKKGQLPTYGLQLHLAETVNSGIDRTTLNDGDAITQWDDLSGNDNHAVENIDFPTYDISDKSIHFAAGTLLFAPQGLSTGSQLRTIFIVMKPINNDNTWYWMEGNWTGNDGFAILNSSINDEIRFGSGDSQMWYANLTTPNLTKIFSAVQNSSNISSLVLNVNGSEQTPLTAGNLVLDVNNIGIAINSVSNSGGNANSKENKYYEFLGYNRALSTTEIQEVESYLSLKYGIPLSTSFLDQLKQMIEDLNAAYDLVVDFIQTDPTNDEINTVIDYLQSIKNPLNTDKINEMIHLLLESLD